MRSFATSRPIRRKRRSSDSWPISSTNTLPRSRIRRSTSSIREAIFRRPRERASTGRNRLRGIESKEAGRRDAARFFASLGITFPSLAWGKRASAQRVKPLLAAGALIGRRVRRSRFAVRLQSLPVSASGRSSHRRDLPAPRISFSVPG